MRKFLKLFEKHMSYEQYLASQNFIIPNVSHCIDVDDVHYNPIPEPHLVTVMRVKNATETLFNVGDTIEIEYIVKNDGNTTFELDTLTFDSVVGGLQNRDVNPTSVFEPGRRKIFDGTHVVTSVDATQGYINTDATVTYTPQSGQSLTFENTMSIATDNPNPSLRVEMTCTSIRPEEGYGLNYGITYEIVVTNDGNLTISNIVVEVNGTTLTTIPSLVPSASYTIQNEYIVTETDILNGSVKLIATADGDNPSEEPTYTGEGDIEEPTVDPDGHLTVSATTISTPPNGECYSAGDVISYQIDVTNDGNLTITSIVVEAENTGFEQTIASLAPGQTRRFTDSYTVTANTGNNFNYVVTASGISPDPYKPAVPVDPDEDPEPICD